MRFSSWYPFGLAGLFAVLLLGAAPRASAQVDEDERHARSTDAHCRRVRSTAESAASLLFFPTVWAEGVHVPVVGDETGMGYVQGGAWQLRASISVSAVDILRGALTLDVAGAECAQLEALARVRQILELGDTIGELAGHRAEQAVLVAATDELETLEHDARRRLTEGLATETQLAALLAERSRLARRIDQLGGAIDRLELAGHERLDASSLRAALRDYESASLALESRRSTLRRTSPWTVAVRAGVVPTGQVDWYGQVQVGVNLGIVAQQLAEDAVLAARADELADGEDELRAHVERLEQRLASSVETLRAEREHVDRQVELADRQLALLASLATSDIDHQRAMLRLTRVPLLAERARLEALIAARAPFEHAVADQRP